MFHYTFYIHLEYVSANNIPKILTGILFFELSYTYRNINMVKKKKII